MSFIKKIFSPKTQKPNSAETPVTNDITLIPNAKYCLTRPMYLFPAQKFSMAVNDYLKIDAIVTFLRTGEIFEENKILSPWVYVRSENGKEGWCSSHYLQRLSEA